jgi:two-component system sensor kinase
LTGIAENNCSKALAAARKFQTDLPHSLRECGLIASFEGNYKKARKYLDESLAVAKRQGARFEHSQTLFARGRVGRQHGWPDAEDDLATARKSLSSLGGDFVLEDATAS